MKQNTKIFGLLTICMLFLLGCTGTDEAEKDAASKMYIGNCIDGSEKVNIFSEGQNITMHLPDPFSFILANVKTTVVTAGDASFDIVLNRIYFPNNTISTSLTEGEIKIINAEMKNGSFYTNSKLAIYLHKTINRGGLLGGNVHDAVVKICALKYDSIATCPSGAIKYEGTLRTFQTADGFNCYPTDTIKINDKGVDYFYLDPLPKVGNTNLWIYEDNLFKSQEIKPFRYGTLESVSTKHGELQYIIRNRVPNYATCSGKWTPVSESTTEYSACITNPLVNMTNGTKNETFGGGVIH